MNAAIIHLCKDYIFMLVKALLLPEGGILSFQFLARQYISNKTNQDLEILWDRMIEWKCFK